MKSNGVLCLLYACRSFEVFLLDFVSRSISNFSRMESTSLSCLYIDLTFLTFLNWFFIRFFAEVIFVILTCSPDKLSVVILFLTPNKIVAPCAWLLLPPSPKLIPSLSSAYDSVKKLALWSLLKLSDWLAESMLFLSLFRWALLALDGVSDSIYNLFVNSSLAYVSIFYCLL